MTLSECLLKLQGYYGTWTNTEVQASATNEIAQYDDSELLGLYQEITRCHPARYGAPDVAAIEKAVTKIRSRRTMLRRSGVKENTTPCPICKTAIRGTRSSCPTCGFIPGYDDVQGHTEWWENYKAGKVQIFDSDKILKSLVFHSTVK